MCFCAHLQGLQPDAGTSNAAVHGHIVSQPTEQTATAEVQEDTDDESKSASAFAKIRGRLKLRSMANTWRSRANNRALPALTPFIPSLLRAEMLQMAQWCADSAPDVD